MSSAARIACWLLVLTYGAIVLAHASMLFQTTTERTVDASATYEIREFPSEQAAKEAGFTVSLTKKEETELRGMNRKERRAWLAQKRRRDRTALKASKNSSCGTGASG